MRQIAFAHQLLSGGALAAATWLRADKTVAAGHSIVASASGAGQFTIGGELRSIRFVAHRDSTDSSLGQAELFSHSTGIWFHMEIDCLVVAGSAATMSGTITRANAAGDEFVDAPFQFQVIDNGEGNHARPDLISAIFIGLGTNVPSTDPSLNATITVERGSIRVH